MILCGTRIQRHADSRVPAHLIVLEVIRGRADERRAARGIVDGVVDDLVPVRSGHRDTRPTHLTDNVALEKPLPADGVAVGIVHVDPVGNSVIDLIVNERVARSALQFDAGAYALSAGSGRGVADDAMLNCSVGGSEADAISEIVDVDGVDGRRTAGSNVQPD